MNPAKTTLLSPLVMAALFPFPAPAETILVPDHFPSIQAAIDAAADGDEILVAPGIYFEKIDFIGKAITLKSTHGPEQTTIDATGLDDSAVKCTSGETPNTILQGFTITGGTGTFILNPNAPLASPDPSPVGGGMLNRSSSPTINHCMFIENTAEIGSGMFNMDNADPLITNCTFAENTDGGGIFSWIDSDPTIANCTFQNNIGRGLIYQEGSSAMVTDSKFIGNIGGGFGAGADNVLVSNCRFVENSAEVGGAISSGGGKTIITNCVFEGNTAEMGGAVSNRVGDILIVECTFKSNDSQFFGGAIAVWSPSAGILPQAVIANSLFAQNTANLGGGIYTFAAQLMVTNCTFVRNSGNQYGAMVLSLSLANVSNCIIWENGNEPIWSYPDSVTFCNVQGGYPGTGNINADPLFLDPDNGDFRLAPGSPCIDAGDNDTVPIDITSDLAGNPRFIDNIITPDTGNPGSAGPPIVDMGAHEAPATVPADIDLDGDVDGNDFAFFAACYNGSSNPPRGGCSAQQSAAFDFDDDNDIDGNDFVKFASCYNGPANPPRAGGGCPPSRQIHQ